MPKSAALSLDGSLSVSARASVLTSCTRPANSARLAINFDSHSLICVAEYGDFPSRGRFFATAKSGSDGRTFAADTASFGAGLSAGVDVGLGLAAETAVTAGFEAGLVLATGVGFKVGFDGFAFFSPALAFTGFPTDFAGTDGADFALAFVGFFAAGVATGAVVLWGVFVADLLVTVAAGAFFGFALAEDGLTDFDLLAPAAGFAAAAAGARFALAVVLPSDFDWVLGLALTAFTCCFAAAGFFSALFAVDLAAVLPAGGDWVDGLEADFKLLVARPDAAVFRSSALLLLRVSAVRLALPWPPRLALGWGVGLDFVLTAIVDFPLEPLK